MNSLIPSIFKNIHPSQKTQKNSARDDIIKKRSSLLSDRPVLKFAESFVGTSHQNSFQNQGSNFQNLFKKPTDKKVISRSSFDKNSSKNVKMMILKQLGEVQNYKCKYKEQSSKFSHEFNIKSNEMPSLLIDAKSSFHEEPKETPNMRKMKPVFNWSFHLGEESGINEVSGQIMMNVNSCVVSEPIRQPNSNQLQVKQQFDKKICIENKQNPFSKKNLKDVPQSKVVLEASKKSFFKPKIQTSNRRSFCLKTPINFSHSKNNFFNDKQFPKIDDKKVSNNESNQLSDDDIDEDILYSQKGTRFAKKFTKSFVKCKENEKSSKNSFLNNCSSFEFNKLPVLNLKKAKLSMRQISIQSKQSSKLSEFNDGNIYSKHFQNNDIPNQEFPMKTEKSDVEDQLNSLFQRSSKLNSQKLILEQKNKKKTKMTKNEHEIDFSSKLRQKIMLKKQMLVTNFSQLQFKKQKTVKERLSSLADKNLNSKVDIIKKSFHKRISLQFNQIQEKPHFAQIRKTTKSGKVSTRSRVQTGKNSNKNYNDFQVLFCSSKKRLVQKIMDNPFEVQTTNEFYKIAEQIGEGSYGKVYKAFSILCGKPVAIKCLDKEAMNKMQSNDRVFQEIQILRSIDNHGVIKLYEIFEDDNYFYMVTEYAEKGDLLSHLKVHKRFNEDEFVPLFRQIVQTLFYLHSKRILHRDIKLDNILINEKKKTKICDFGISLKLKENEIVYEHIGTPAYLAPEIVLGEGYSEFNVDIWSLGVTAYIALTGKGPFRGNEIEELQTSIVLEPFHFPSDIKISAQMRTLISKMLEKDCSKRISLEEIAVKLGVDLIYELDVKQNTLDNKKLDQIKAYGFSESQLIQDLQIGAMNHATALYKML